MLAEYIDANTVIALASAVAAAASALFALALFLNNRKVERAYVKISHPSPGIRQLDSSGNIWLKISIKNYGRTPARVTNVVIKPVVVPRGDQLPIVPDYTVQHEDPNPQAFLVTDDEVFLDRGYKITPDEMFKVKSHLSDLYMIGYVDYTDQFDQHHRAGYARKYDLLIDLRTPDKTEEEFARRNNLNVVAKQGYNYDRVRK